MCKCRILIEADLDGYMLDNMVLEEMALQDVIQATTDDFACIVHHAPETVNFVFQIACTCRLQGFHFARNDLSTLAIRQAIASTFTHLIIFRAAIV